MVRDSDSGCVERNSSARRQQIEKPRPLQVLLVNNIEPIGVIHEVSPVRSCNENVQHLLLLTSGLVHGLLRRVVGIGDRGWDGDMQPLKPIAARILEAWSLDWAVLYTTACNTLIPK